MFPTQKQIDDALRYLKVPQEGAGDFADEVRQAFEEVSRAARPGKVWGRFALKVYGGSVYLGDGTISCHSDSLSRLFRNCHSCAVMAVTLGAGIDLQTRALARENMSRALAFDACASVLADSLCDEAEAEVQSALAPGEFLTMRFSPGYGDVPLNFSAGLLKMVDAERRIGLTLSGRGMMIPVKSVTALTGISDRPVKRPAGCEACGKTDCPYRRKGTDCHDKKV
jgi:hypothetical protein